MNTEKHVRAALSFGDIADLYNSSRPGVPDAALSWLVPDNCAHVVDLAAGTGAITRSLVSRVPLVTAIEPDSRMRVPLARTCPAAQILHGTAENMPLPDKSADALVIAMAWHWVDADRALPEIGRVLRPGGTFGVLWNHRDLSVPWVAELDRYTRQIRASESSGPTISHTANSKVGDPVSGDLYTAFDELIVSWEMELTTDGLVRHLSTDASAIALSPGGRRTVDSKVATYLRQHLGVVGDDLTRLPMICRCLRAKRLIGN